MSGVYPYCIVATGHDPPAGLTGLDHSAVEGHAIGSLTVWASQRGERPSLDLERVTQHHEVVRRAAASTTPLPVRFGAWAPDRPTLLQRIDRSRDDLETALARVSGCVELGVTVLEASDASAAEATDDPAPDGRDYLRGLSRIYAERRGRRERQDAVAEDVRALLDVVSRATRVRLLPPPGLVALAHLVAREDEMRYRGLLDSFTPNAGVECRVHVTGPWPPYSFVAP